MQDPGAAPGAGLQCGQYPKLLPGWLCWTFPHCSIHGFTGVLLASGSHPQPGCAPREVGTGVILTCYDQLGVEEPGILLQLVIVDVTSLGVDLGEEEEGSATRLVKISCSAVLQEGMLAAWCQYF